MYGLVLEGGGAKGAYHIGVYRALLEEGIEVGGVVGTSIGAINGAMIAQGDHEKCSDLWKNVTYSMVMDVDDREIEKLMSLKPSKENFAFVGEQIKRLVGDRGFDITPLKDLLKEYIDEEKARTSGLDFGIVTVNLSELKPVYIFLEDIPDGELCQYLLASAYLPIFKAEKLGGKRYIDGGFYDNLPYRMLVEKGYKKLILVRTNAVGITRKIDLEEEETITISPSGELGNLMEFDQVRAQENIKMGYYDGLRAFRNLKGHKYYIKARDDKFYLDYILKIREDQVREMEKILKIHGGDYKRTLLEAIIPKIASLLSLDKNHSYEDIIIGLLEKYAEKNNIDRYKIYDFEELLQVVGELDMDEERENLGALEKIIEKVEILPIINKEESLLEIGEIVFGKR